MDSVTALRSAPRGENGLVEEFFRSFFGTKLKIRAK